MIDNVIFEQSPDETYEQFTARVSERRNRSRTYARGLRSCREIGYGGMPTRAIYDMAKAASEFPDVVAEEFPEMADISDRNAMVSKFMSDHAGYVFEETMMSQIPDTVRTIMAMSSARVSSLAKSAGVPPEAMAADLASGGGVLYRRALDSRFS